jgi:hypothetical protein
MGALWRVLEWIGLILGTGIAVVAALILLARRRILRRVAADLAGEPLLLAAGAQVGEYHGANGAGPPPAGAAGILMLFGSGLYFRSWVGSREVFVSGPAISWIGVPESLPPRQGTSSRVGRHRIVVRFLNAAGKEDGIAVRLLYPEQWVNAIKTHLISRS